MDIFRDFPASSEKFRDSLSTMPRPLSCRSFPVHYPSVTLQSDAAKSRYWRRRTLTHKYNNSSVHLLESLPATAFYCRQVLQVRNKYKRKHEITNNSNNSIKLFIIYNNNNNNSFQFIYLCAWQERVTYNRLILKVYINKTGLSI
jgi:hypothetical protein